MTSAQSRLQELSIDHVTLYVDDAGAMARDFAERYGLEPYATAEVPGQMKSVALGGDRVRLVLTQALGEDHPAACYVREHGDGVADIAMATPDAEASFAEAVRRGARPLAEPAEADGVITAAIAGFGDIRHSFVQRRPDAAAGLLPGFIPVGPGRRESGTQGRGDGGTRTGLREIDHLAVCLEAGSLRPTVDFYQQILGFRNTFTERILVGGQAMESEVMQSASGGVTLTLIEPDTSAEPGQIDFFIKNHGGSGVQHIAFRTDDIVRTVAAMREQEVEFLTSPDAYYRMLGDRLQLARHSVDELASMNILADEDHEGQLYQIFTRTVHPRKTLFFEVIERVGATTFGTGNIKALYEAVEAEQAG